MGGAAAASESSPSPGALGRGRGLARTTVNAALREAEDAGRMTTEHQVRAVLAKRYAELVDRASAAGDGPALMKAGEKLLEVLDTLPVRSSAGGGSADDGSTGRGLALVLDGPPALGDTADA